MGIHNAYTVGPEHAHIIFAAYFQQLSLQLKSLFTGFLKAGGNHHKML